MNDPLISLSEVKQIALRTCMEAISRSNISASFAVHPTYHSDTNIFSSNITSASTFFKITLDQVYPSNAKIVLANVTYTPCYADGTALQDGALQPGTYLVNIVGDKLCFNIGRVDGISIDELSKTTATVDDVVSGKTFYSSDKTIKSGRLSLPTSSLYMQHMPQNNYLEYSTILKVVPEFLILVSGSINSYNQAKEDANDIRMIKPFEITPNITGTRKWSVVLSGQVISVKYDQYGSGDQWLDIYYGKL